MGFTSFLVHHALTDFCSQQPLSISPLSAEASVHPPLCSKAVRRSQSGVLWTKEQASILFDYRAPPTFATSSFFPSTDVEIDMRGAQLSRFQVQTLLDNEGVVDMVGGPNTG